MGGLNHADIVCTIADSEENGLLILLDEFDDQCLLQRRYTTYFGVKSSVSARRRNGLTANDRLAKDCKLQECLRNLLLEGEGEALSI